MKLRWKKIKGFTGWFYQADINVSPMLLNGAFIIEEIPISNGYKLSFCNSDYDKKIKVSKSIDTLKRHAEKVLERTAKKLGGK